MFNQKVKRLIETYVPAVLHNACYYPAYLLRAKLKRHDILAIRSIRPNRRKCIIAGTGPSVKNVPLEVYSEYDVFSVSNFYLHEWIATINPFAQFFVPFHFPMVLENYIEWLRSADEVLRDDCLVFLGTSDKKLIVENGLFLKKTVIYLDFSPYKPASINIEKPILSPQTGPLMALPVALFLEYEEISLIGCDHNILKNYGGKVEHFYRPDMESRTNTNGAGYWTSIVDELKTNLRVFDTYDYYKTLNRSSKIINRSFESWLELFDRVPWK
jgi:hypothetical protein